MCLCECLGYLCKCFGYLILGVCYLIGLVLNCFCCLFCCSVELAVRVALSVFRLVLVAVLAACLCLVNTAVSTVSVLLYFTIRFLEFVTSGDHHNNSTNSLFIDISRHSGNFGDSLANGIIYGSLVNLLLGWDIWWFILCYYAPNLKHHVILELELIKWVQLFMIFSALCIPLMLPRFILASTESVNHYRQLFDGVVGVIECSVFILAQLAVMKHAPNWTRHMALGFETWRLIQVLALILLGIMIINVITRLIVHILNFVDAHCTKHVAYFSYGLRPNINFMFTWTYLTAIWLLYFVPHFNKTGVWTNKRAMELVSWGFVCVAIGSFLWFIKKLVVLLWEAHAVYDRFSDKIIQAGSQFYFIRLIFDKEFLTDKNRRHNDEPLFNYLGKYLRNRGNNEQQQVENQEQKKQDAKDILVPQEHHLTTYDLQSMTDYYKNLYGQDNWLQDNEYTEDNNTTTPSPTSDQMEKITKPNDMRMAIKRMYVKTLDLEDAETLLNQMKSDTKSAIIDDKGIKKWMAKAYENCSELGNTLLDANEVTSYLNKLLIGFFLPLIILIWLLATKIASIDLLILVTSPILTAKFIFGGTCKSIFQGIIFTFVLHLFDVGDTCIINGAKMEVKRIGIWTTTFRKVDTKETVIYRNSILADKVIIKQTGLNLNDSVEYSVPVTIWDQSTLEDLKATIQRFIDRNSAEYDKHSLAVLVKEVGHKVKIVIQFKHKASGQDMINSEVLKEQKIRRQNILMEVKEFFDGKQ